MKKLLIIFIIVLVLAGIAAAVFFFSPAFKYSKATDIKTFEDCQASGALVVDTIPRECHTKFQQIFIEIYNGTQVKDVIQVTDPKPYQLVANPFKLEGKAVGGWYYNDQLSVKLEDDNGKVIMVKGAKAKESTKTNAMVPFTAAITYKPEDVTAETGKLIIEKTNVTFEGIGNPLVIPVKFKKEPEKK